MTRENQAQIERIENELAELEKQNEELQNENQQLKDAQDTPAEPEKDEIDPEALAGLIADIITVTDDALVIDSGASEDYTYDYYQENEQQASFMDSFPDEDKLFLIYDVQPEYTKIYIQFAKNESGELKVIDIYNGA